MGVDDANVMLCGVFQAADQDTNGNDFRAILIR
jgi:hypothetical protein